MCILVVGLGTQRCVALDISWRVVSLIMARSWLDHFLDEDEKDISARQARCLALNCVEGEKISAS